MAEQQIANLASHAAPLTRVTKDSEEFELLAVNANFDGSGAVSAFLPCVEVVSDAGLVVARNPASESVAAGDSAEVTFAPFLRKGFGVSQLAHEIGFYDVEPIGGNPWNAASTFNALNFSFGGNGAGTDLLDLTTYGAAAPLPLVAGMYAVAVALFFTPGGGGTFAANKTVRVVLLLSNDFSPQNFYSQSADATFPLDNSYTSSAASVGWTRYFDPANLNGTIHEAAFFEVDVYKPLAASLNVFGQVSVQRLY